MRTRGRTYGKRKKYTEEQATPTPSPPPAPASRRGRKRLHPETKSEKMIPQNKVRISERIATKQHKEALNNVKNESDLDTTFKNIGLPGKYLNLFKSEPIMLTNLEDDDDKESPKKRRIGRRGTKGSFLQPLRNSGLDKRRGRRACKSC